MTFVLLLYVNYHLLGKAGLFMDVGNHTATIYLPHNIRCLRKRRNLSQEELANQVGLNRGNIASYEKGTAEPKICNLLKLSHLFEVSIIDLTQKDLSDEATLVAASNNYQKVSKGEREVLRQFFNRAEEYQKVINGLHTCHQFKLKSFSDLPKDMQVMMANFEQLYDAAQALLNNHKALIDFIKCRMK